MKESRWTKQNSDSKGLSVITFQILKVSIHNEDIWGSIYKQYSQHFSRAEIVKNAWRVTQKHKNRYLIHFQSSSGQVDTVKYMEILDDMMKT